MGNGYWIIIGDDWGSGLNIVNPRLYEEHNRNWWPCSDTMTKKQIYNKHSNGLEKYDVFHIVKLWED